MQLFGQNTVLKVMHLILTYVSDTSPSWDINKTYLLCVNLILQLFVAFKFVYVSINN